MRHWSLLRVRRGRAPPGHPLVTWLVSVAFVAYVLVPRVRAATRPLPPRPAEGFRIRPVPVAPDGTDRSARRARGRRAGRVVLLSPLAALLGRRRSARWWLLQSPDSRRKRRTCRPMSAGIVAGLAANGDRGFTALGEYAPNGVNPFDLDHTLVSAPEVRGAGHVLRWERKHGDVYGDGDRRRPEHGGVPRLVLRLLSRRRRRRDGQRARAAGCPCAAGRARAPRLPRAITAYNLGASRSPS